MTILLFALVNESNVTGILASYCLQWVNNIHDNNVDNVSIVLLRPRFMGEHGIQATESPGELF